MIDDQTKLTNHVAKTPSISLHSSMAMNHRKLYPTSNQTLNCQDNCDPSCPYACYPYPDYYFFPPPPPAMAAESSKSHSLNSSPYAIVLITFTATFLLIIGYYAIFTRRCLSRRSSILSHVGEEFLDENRGPMIDNPIWYITTIGLQPSVINSITVVNYSKASGLIDCTDCSICLNEFQEDETLRLLPKCNHAFHVLCIDTWLRSHTNCPTCRCSILSNTDNNSQSLENNSASDHLDPNHVTATEIQQPDEELDANQSQEQNESHQIVDEAKGSGFWVVDIREDDESDDIIQIHTMKRSFSINSSSILHLGVECEASSTNSRLYKMMRGSSISKSLHKRPVSMKRSFSYSGRSFRWRHYRNHKAMVRLRIY